MVSIDRPGNQTIRILHKHDVPELLCQPKINDAHDLIRGQAEVRQFYVAVQKVLGMHLLNPAKWIKTPAQPQLQGSTYHERLFWIQDFTSLSGLRMGKQSNLGQDVHTELSSACIHTHLGHATSCWWAWEDLIEFQQPNGSSACLKLWQRSNKASMAAEEITSNHQTTKRKNWQHHTDWSSWNQLELQTFIFPQSFADRAHFETIVWRFFAALGKQKQRNIKCVCLFRI